MYRNDPLQVLFLKSYSVIMKWCTWPTQVFNYIIEVFWWECFDFLHVKRFEQCLDGTKSLSARPENPVSHEMLTPPSAWRNRNRFTLQSSSFEDGSSIICLFLVDWSGVHLLQILPSSVWFCCRLCMVSQTWLCPLYSVLGKNTSCSRSAQLGDSKNK